MIDTNKEVWFIYTETEEYYISEHRTTKEIVHHLLYWKIIWISDVEVTDWFSFKLLKPCYLFYWKHWRRLKSYHIFETEEEAKKYAIENNMTLTTKNIY